MSDRSPLSINDEPFNQESIRASVVIEEKSEMNAGEVDTVEMMDEDDDSESENSNDILKSIDKNMILDRDDDEITRKFNVDDFNNNSNDKLSNDRLSDENEPEKDKEIEYTGDVNNTETPYPLDADEETADRKRFQIELEFVQSLANPNYLNFLAQRGYFKNQTFLNYLKYLMYWKEPEYSRYLVYPQCLFLLEMLQQEKFLNEIVNAQCSKYIDEQVLLGYIIKKKEIGYALIQLKYPII